MSSSWLQSEVIWFILGSVLFVMELILPGFVLFFFGVGAWITALLCLLIPLGNNLQIILFIIFSVTSLLCFRRLIKRKFFTKNDSNSQNVDDDITGSSAIAINTFKAGEIGKVEFRGSNWQATSKYNIQEGEIVIIVSKQNTTLYVEPK